MNTKKGIAFIDFCVASTLNSYAMLFFSKNNLFALLIIAVTFFNPFPGLVGMVSVLTSLGLGYLLGFSRENLKSGIYGYPALLVGLGLATYYEPGSAFFLLLFTAIVLSLLLSVALTGKLGLKSLPALSLSFIFSTWIIILASGEFSAIGLTQRHIYWMNDLFARGGKSLIDLVMWVENLPMPAFVSGFFRSMSAILFHINIISGILLSIGVLLYSRIAFLLMIQGYTIAFLFQLVMGNAGIINYYNLGTNYMLVSVAVGGIYLIPSLRSFIWAALLVPISYLLVIGLGRITFTWGLPVFSMPFCIVVILFLYCLRLRKVPGKLVPTPIQYFSPEVNLYRYLNGKERLMNRFYFPLQLPFLGEWMVSQGYEGQMTHKGDWSKALDFVILDNEMKTYANPGILPEHFYCFNKPVLSPGDGIIEEVVDHVPDNAIGQNNMNENWGNSIVIRHADGLYSKLSHLKQHSVKVVKGAWVKKGDIIALCGNSGRSPEPHLHFQVQATPYIGSKTIHYPISHFKSRRSQQKAISNFQVPMEGSFVGNILTDAEMQRAFAFQPGFCMQVEAEGYAPEEWEVFSNMYNESYLYCKQNDSYAYFINNGTVFYFTNFFGKKKSLLYGFYLASYKVMLASDIEVPVKDKYPLNVYGLSPLRWLQDLVAPFWIFIRIEFEMLQQGSNDYLNSDQVTLNSKRTHRVFSFSKEKSSASIHIRKGIINHFTIRSSTNNIMAICKYKN